MADDGGFDAEHGSTTSFSQLLFSDDVLAVNVNYLSAFSDHEKPPKMLCFGDYNQQNEGKIVVHDVATPQKPAITCSDSSSASSGNNSSAYTTSKSTKKRNGSVQDYVPCANLVTTTAQVASKRTCKKTKAGDNSSSSTGHARAKKEKLGNRITALQRLVSPFGKTDTASVLHEAMGYIKFLHDQVQVLCSPYLQHHLLEGGENGGEEESRKDLTSRGLCLIPLSCTVHVESSNGADYWSPAAMGSNVSSSASAAAAAKRQSK